MNRWVRCWVAAGVLLVVGCGGEETGAPTPTGTEVQVNPLEASGMVEFFVKIVGTVQGAFRGETVNQRFLGSVPAIRYYSQLDKPAAGPIQCTTFQFTKVAGPTSPLFVRAISTNETLKSVHMDFVRGATSFIWQKVDLTGMRVSKLEQAVAPPVGLAPSAILEEVTLVPTGGLAKVTLTAIPQLATGAAGAAIVSTFTCGNSGSTGMGAF